MDLTIVTMRLSCLGEPMGLSASNYIMISRLFTLVYMFVNQRAGSFSFQASLIQGQLQTQPCPWSSSPVTLNNLPILSDQASLCLAGRNGRSPSLVVAGELRV